MARFDRLRIQAPARATARPIAAPPASWTMPNSTQSTTVGEARQTSMAPMVSRMAMGSLSPDSTWSSWRTRAGSGAPRMAENTAAASVDAMTAPIRNDVEKGRSSTARAVSPAMAAVIATPIVASTRPGPTTRRNAASGVDRPPS